MPASMISAPIGSNLKVIGSSIAMVATGPTPGSTPISVPTRQPTKQSRMFIGIGTMPMPGNVDRHELEDDPEAEGEVSDEIAHQVSPVREGEGRLDGADGSDLAGMLVRHDVDRLAARAGAPARRATRPRRPRPSRPAVVRSRSSFDQPTG